MTSPQCLNNRFYKDLSCALIEELLNDLKQDTSELSIQVFTIMAEMTELMIHNGYLTNGSIHIVCVSNVEKEIRVSLDLYENDKIIWNFERNSSPSDPTSRFYAMNFVPELQEEKGPFHTGVNTYYVKDNITGTCSNKFTIRVVDSE